VGKLQSRLLLLLDVNRLMAETETREPVQSAPASPAPAPAREEALVS